MKHVFTTVEVAKICKVAPRTVGKWFDSGRLRGYRIPGTQDRRIPREHLIRFLKEHGMPLGELEDEGKSSSESPRQRFDCTPEQYHAGLDKLWVALKLEGVQDKDVFTLAAERIEALEAMLDATESAAQQLADEVAEHDKQMQEMEHRAKDEGFEAGKKGGWY